MPSALPAGEAIPDSGPLPAGVTARAPFGVYVHVPFCATRCGYCDFNTYTLSELGGDTGPDAFVAAARTEIRLARASMGEGAPPVSTVFFGGGTPTMLAPELLGALLAEITACFGLEDGAEVTTEANPESVDARALATLRRAGFLRLSLGMQSAAPHVLAVLDRVHTPGRPAEAVAEARAAGFEQVSLDLIYGTPGESDTDWRESLDVALSAGPDHLSAYALVVEEGTRLARSVRVGLLPAPDEDVLAERYLVADAALSAAALGWYEISNWGDPCRHNMGYWRSHDWWGIGPGAHSHVGGVRWWNVSHPARYAGLLGAGRSPAAGRELLDGPTRQVERVLLGVRLREGYPVVDLPRPQAVPLLVDQGLLDGAAAEQGRVVLTLKGRLLADTVVRALS